MRQDTTGRALVKNNDESGFDQSKIEEIRRFMFQLDNILEFSKDDASDAVTLCKLLDQAVGVKIGLNVENIS